MMMMVMGANRIFPHFFFVKIACQLDAEWNIMFLSLFFIKDIGDDDDWSVDVYIR